MRVLNLNFLSCAVKACKVSNKSFPLHPKDAELAEDDEVAYKPEILVSILPRLDWEALRTTCTEVSCITHTHTHTHTQSLKHHTHNHLCQLYRI